MTNVHLHPVKPSRFFKVFVLRKILEFVAFLPFSDHKQKHLPFSSMHFGQKLKWIISWETDKL